MLRNIWFILLCCLFLLPLTQTQAQEKLSPSPVSVILTDFEGLEEVFQKEDDTLRVINFWATWCVPCVKELPDFEKVSKEHLGEAVQFIYVSLDMDSHLEKRVIPFLQARDLPGKHYLLDDPDANAWIPIVSEKWTGAIPATLIYKNKERYFHEGMMDYEMLKARVRTMM
jgi:thiol-disulfide isomerase/thioredoxin